MAYKLTDEDRKLAEQLGQQLAAQNAAQNAAATAPKKHDAGMLGTILSTIGGIGGGLLGIPFGGVGAIAGGAGGSALGRGLANLLTGATGSEIGEGVAEEAVLGGVGGALGKFMKIGGVGAKAAQNATKTSQAGANAVGAAPKSGLLARFGQKAENTGNKLMASQANLTRAQARNLSEPVADTFGKLQTRTGLGNMDDLSEVGKGITGREGMVNLGVDDAASRVGVKLDGMRRAAEDSLINRGIPANSTKGKEILENVKNQAVKADGGSSGSLSTVVGGKQALDVDRFFAENANVARQGFKRSGDVATKQAGQVYQDLSNFVKDRLYNAPGASQNFMAKGGGKEQIVQSLRAMSTDDVVTANPKIRAAYGKLADEFDEGVKSIADARTFQKDFVRLNQIAEKTAQAEMGAAMQLGGNNMQGLGRFFQNPLNIVAAPANAQSGRVGSFLARTGQKMQGRGASSAGNAAANTGGKLTRRDLVKSLVAQGVPRAALGGLLGGGAAAAATELSPDAMAALGADPTSFTADQLAAAGLSGAVGSGSDVPGGVVGAQVGADGAMMGVTQESLNQALIAAATRGDAESVSMLINVGDYLFGGADGGKMSSAAQKSLMGSDNALASVQRLEQLLAQNPGQDNGVLANIFGGAASVAGGVGLNDNARVYNDISQSLITPLARSISGETGQLSNQDIERAAAMLPKLTDSNEVRQQKLQNIYAAISASQDSAMQRGGGGTTVDAAQLATVLGGGY